ncbi:MAG: CbtB-domain containing protein [Pseudonocardiaceae bacterium]|nr:CbtB-domain containing protein [Pseudonocardiaceae bacterium]
MTHAVATPALAPVHVPVRELVPWVIFVGAVMLVLLYFVGLEQSAVSVFAGNYLHELLHDGRHLLGFPCH